MHRATQDFLSFVDHHPRMFVSAVALHTLIMGVVAVAIAGLLS